MAKNATNLVIIEDFIYDNNSDTFELRSYENQIKNNLAEAAVNIVFQVALAPVENKPESVIFIDCAVIIFTVNAKNNKVIFLTIIIVFIFVCTFSILSSCLFQEHFLENIEFLAKVIILKQ